MRRPAAVIAGLLVLTSVVGGGVWLYASPDHTPPPPSPPVVVRPNSVAPREAAQADWLRGNAAMERQAFADAVAAYDEAIRTDPTYALAYLSRGNARLGLQDYDAALADFGAAIERDTDLPDAYLSRGMAYWLRGDLSEALADFRTLTGMRPDDFFYAKRYTGVLYEMDRGADAEAFYRTTYRDNPSRSWALEAWFATLAARGGWEEMRGEAQRLFDAGETGRVVRTAIGEAHFGLGQYSDAIVWLAPIVDESATEVDPNAILHLAAAYRSTGQVASCQRIAESYAMRIGRQQQFDPSQCGSETAP